MKKNKTDIIRENIIERISQLDIAGFLKEEIASLFKHLHYYKLNNVLTNIDSLEEYLVFLDKENTEQFLKLSENSKSIDESIEDISYQHILSNKGFETIGSENVFALLSQNDNISSDVQLVISGMQGLLLLTANEFCHASMTRMSINREIWHKQNS